MRFIAFAVCGEQIFLSIDDLATASLLLRARSGRSEGLRILKKMSASSPEAKYLLGRHFEGHSIDVDGGVSLIASAASEGYPPAMYTMGAYLDLGEHLQEDKSGAMGLFQKAAKRGHAHSMWLYGVAQIYGAPGVEIDQDSGLKWVKRSAKLKFVEALETLAQWHESGELGVSVDAKKAARLRQKKEDVDAIQLT